MGDAFNGPYEAAGRLTAAARPFWDDIKLNAALSGIDPMMLSARMFYPYLLAGLKAVFRSEGLDVSSLNEFVFNDVLPGDQSPVLASDDVKAAAADVYLKQLGVS